MAAATLILDHLPGETRAAAVSDGTITDIAIDRADRPDPTGAILVVRVDQPAPQLGGSFVDVGGARGFLKGDQPAAGTQLAAELVHPARAAKPASLTAKPELRGRFVRLVPGRRPGLRLSHGLAESQRGRFDRLGLARRAGCGVVVRRAAAEAADDAVLAELDRLAAAWAAAPAAATQPPGTGLVPAPSAPARLLMARPWPAAIAVPAWCRNWAAREVTAIAPDLAERITGAAAEPDPLAAAGWAETVAQALGRDVRVPGGGWLSFEATQALTAVDVDLADRPGPGAHRGLGLAASPVIAAELRRRNTAGLVAVDMPAMGRRDAAAVRDALATATAGDPAGVRVLGWTPGGLIELQRRRRGPALADLMLARAGGPDPVAAGFDACRAVAASTSPALVLSAHPTVAATLAEAGQCAAALAQAAGRRRVTVTADPAAVPGGWALADG